MKRLLFTTASVLSVLLLVVLALAWIRGPDYLSGVEHNHWTGENSYHSFSINAGVGKVWLSSLAVSDIPASITDRHKVRGGFHTVDLALPVGFNPGLWYAHQREKMPMFVAERRMFAVPMWMVATVLLIAPSRWVVRRWNGMPNRA